MNKKLKKIVAVAIVLGFGYWVFNFLYTGFWAIPPVISLRLLCDRIHLSPDKDVIYFDDLPEFAFPSNTIIHCYKIQNERAKLLYFAFYIPKGEMIYLRDLYMDRYIGDAITAKERKKIKKEYTIYYAGADNFDAVNKIPHLNVSDVRQYIEGHKIRDSGTLEWSEVRTSSGAYFYGHIVIGL